MEKELLAHVRQDENENWLVHSLKEHLEGTAKLAEKFAAVFGLNKLADIVGKVHDYGKASQKFQDKIDPELHVNPHVDHSIAGAQFLVLTNKNIYSESVGLKPEKPVFQVSFAGVQVDECPRHQECRPDKQMGSTLYIASATNPRLFPLIPRDSQRFKDLYTECSGTERGNSPEDSYQLDQAHHNAVYGLIRLTFVNFCKHVLGRYHSSEPLQTHS